MTLYQLLEKFYMKPFSRKKKRSEREQKEEAALYRSADKRAIPEGNWWLDWIQKKSTGHEWFWSLINKIKKNGLKN